MLLGAAGTFRAAADDQLREWAHRIGADIVGGQPGADPASIAYDAYQAAKARETAVVIVDTAGRLQSKANLMDELSKVARVLEREAGSIDEVLLVIDGTTGQNATAQARRFSEAVGVTGIVITKLDGTARGGVVTRVAASRLRELCRRNAGTHSRGTRAAAARLATWYDERAQDLSHRFPGAYRKVRGKRWKRLRRTMKKRRGRRP